MKSLSTKRLGMVAALLSVFAGGCADLTDSSTSEQGVHTTATVTPNKTTYLSGESITVTFAGFVGSESDWITIADKTAPDNAYLAFQYTPSGSVTGQVTFNVNLPNGLYEIRGYMDWNNTQSSEVEARAEFSISTPALASSVTTDSSSYSAGAPITVNYTGLAGTSSDWISIALPGSAPDSFVRYVYTSGTVDGSVQFGSGLADGTYVARSYNNDSFVIVNESAQFTVGNMISTSQSSYLPAESIIVNYQGVPSAPDNWIALATAGSPMTSYHAYQYITNSSGQLTFNPLPAGNYEARVFLNDSFTLAGSSSFTVGSAVAPTITTSQASYVEGQTITTTYTVTGNPSDWVAISAAGATADSYLRYQYVNSSGSAEFGGNLAPGNYEMRLYSNDSFVILDSATFSVTAAPAPAPVDVTTTAATYSTSEPVLVNYTNLGGNGDWIGISVAGSADNSYVTYIYTAGVADGQVSFSGLPVGSYEARGYLNDTFTVADRTTFTVQ